jgi:PBP1b-binding outer membrane lipoprotein LpoB
MKKFITVLALAFVFVACNNAAEGEANTKDSLDSIANASKNMIDSSADATKNAIDSTTDAQKQAADSTRIVNDSTRN